MSAEKYRRRVLNIFGEIEGFAAVVRDTMLMQADEEFARAIADARAQGVRDAVQWLSRQGCRPNLAYLMSCELQPEIHRLSALPPDPIPGERCGDTFLARFTCEREDGHAGGHRSWTQPLEPRQHAQAALAAPTPTRCDNPDGPCACGAWHGDRPAPPAPCLGFRSAADLPLCDSCGLVFSEHLR